MNFLVIEFRYRVSKKANIMMILDIILDLIKKRGIKVDESSPYESVDLSPQRKEQPKKGIYNDN